MPFPALSAAVAALTITVSLSPAPVVGDYEMCSAAVGEIAKTACERVIQDGRANLGELADIYIDRGQVHYTKREFELAIAAFNMAVRLDPAAPLAFGNRANAYAMLNNDARALADYSQAIEIDPSYTAAYTGRGLIYEARGERSKAMRDFNTALALTPKYQDGVWAQQTAKAHLRGYGEATAGQTLPSRGEANAEHTRR